MFSTSLDGKYSIGNSVIVNTRNGSVEVNGVAVRLRRQLYLSLLLLMENRIHDAFVPNDDFSKTLPEGRAYVDECISNDSIRKIVSGLNAILKTRMIVPFNGIGYYLQPCVKQLESSTQVESPLMSHQTELSEMVEKLNSLINRLPDIIEKTCAMTIYQSNILKSVPIADEEKTFIDRINIHSLVNPETHIQNGNYKTGNIVLRHWKLSYLLGKGSVGSVYEAIREEYGVTQKAAIKIIHVNTVAEKQATEEKNGFDWQLFRSIYGEVAILQALQGRSHITCYEDHEVVELEDGSRDLIIRMELLTPITKSLTENQMSQKNIVKIGIDICKALESCHSLGIIHRDVKPENIYVSSWGEYKLGDFGASTTVSSLSNADRVFTPQYAAPEVFRGEPYSFNADIYSLGIVMYYLLNDNRLPFMPEGPYPYSSSERNTALSRRIAGEQIPRIPKTSHRLQDVILKACTFDPKMRYSSASEMRQALERC